MHPRPREELGGLCHGLTAPKEEKKDNNGSGSSGDEQIRLDPYCLFYRYFREKDGKGARKGKDNHG